MRLFGCEQLSCKYSKVLQVSAKRKVVGNFYFSCLSVLKYLFIMLLCVTNKLGKVYVNVKE